MNEETKFLLLAALETYIAQLERTSKALHTRGLPEAGASIQGREGQARTIHTQLSAGTLEVKRADLVDGPSVSPSTLKNK